MMDFFDFGIYFAAVIVVAVLVFWIVFLLVKSLRPKKRTNKKMLAGGKKSSMKRIAQKAQSKDSETETEIEFDENDIESTDLSDIAPKIERKQQPKAPSEEPETSMAMESTLEGEETKQTATTPGESHSLVSSESPKDTKPPAPPVRRDQKQTPASAVTSESNEVAASQGTPDPNKTPESGDTSEQEQATAEEQEKPLEEAPEGAATVKVKDDIGELTGEPPSVTEAKNEENEEEGDIFDVFDTELEEETKLADFAAGLADVDLGDLQSLTRDLHAILPAKSKSEDSKEDYEE